MKKLLLISLVAVLPHVANAQNWKNDKSNTRIGFAATHLLISEVHGSFNSFNMNLVSKKEDFSDAQIDVSAEVASISTNNEIRDKNLKSSDFFDAEKFPQLLFKSESLTKISGNKYTLKGELTMHGVSRKVVLDVIFNGMAINSFNNLTMAGFKITGMIKRLDFKIGEGTPGVEVRDEIKLEIDVEFAMIKT